ncbi:MAG TPA: uroporphyrinogen decarboxylase family protein, partial [Spirochaetota bacterium]|nr:uroporphyrinogen decarboxylase family protein [Spirochaetota bacterium]
MNGKERILKILNGVKTDRIPWIPYTGVQSGSLTNVKAAALYQDKDKLLAALEEANRLYHPDGQPVIFDLQIEAEILGCELEWADKAPPSVRSYPLQNSKILPDRLPSKSEGRIPVVLAVMDELKKTAGKDTALYGLICGPLTLASHLRGTNLF